MKQLFNMALYEGCFDEYGGVQNLPRVCAALGCDGVEVIHDGCYKGPMPDSVLTLGYHLCFWPDWVDFWRGDEAALLRKFGSRSAWVSFYGGETREALLRCYREDLKRAQSLHARYAVFHVSDASVEEQFLYRWEHTDAEVIDAAAELLNELTDGWDAPFPILLENQWWPGFRFNDPKLTERLLDRVRCPNVGLLLDTGHLLNTELSLKTQAEGADYILRMLDRHASLTERIKAMHLHYSLSGDYVRAHTGVLPRDLSPDYMTRYGQNYAHILNIDRHLPWTDASVARVVSRIAPDYLVHELAADSRAEKERAVRVQSEALKSGDKMLFECGK